MKKILLTLSGSLLISLFALQAQQQNDTTGTASESRQRQGDRYGQPQQQTDRTQQQDGDQAWQQQNDKNQSRDAYANEGMVIIDKAELPASLKKTLKDEKYQGWETGTIYHNTNTGEYVIAPRAYRFDESGKEIAMDNTTGYGDSQNRQGQYNSDQNQRANSNGTRESERSAQQQARDEMGEIPTSASKDQDNGQSDGNASPSQQEPSRSYRSDQSDANPQSEPGQTSQNQYRSENMVEIQAEQVPASLRSTLRESQYQGWEKNGTLYQDRSTQEYVLEMNQTDNSSQPRTYRFDRHGELKGDQNGSSQDKQ